MLKSIIKNFFLKEKHDFETLEGIQNIPIPNYKPLQGMGSPVNNIEYILQKKATEHKKNGRMDLAIACLRKANEIFPHSNFSWSEKDYMRLVEYLKSDRQFDEARKEEQKIRGLFAKFDREREEHDAKINREVYGNTDIVSTNMVEWFVKMVDERRKQKDCSKEKRLVIYEHKHLLFCGTI